MTDHADTSRPAMGVLEEMTLEDIRAFDPQVVVLGIGSTEPHGPHLPYGTDNYRVDGVVRPAVIQANQQGGRVLMYPTLRISNNVNFKAFPFACRIRVRTLMNVILDIVEALEEDGIRKIVLVNGHGGNPDTLQAALREHVERHPPGQGAFVCLTHPFTFIPPQDPPIIENASDHAGEGETTAIMHLQPHLVRTDKLNRFPTHQPELDLISKTFFVRPWHGYMPHSAGGETRQSTAEKGRRMHELAVSHMADFLTRLSQTPWHDLFPYAAQK